MIFISDQTVQSGKVLVTTPRGKEYHPSERHTGKVAGHMARDDSKRHSSKTWIIVLVVVAIAVVIVIIISLLVRFSCLQRRKLWVNSSSFGFSSTFCRWVNQWSGGKLVVLTNVSMVTTYELPTYKDYGILVSPK